MTHYSESRTSLATTIRCDELCEGDTIIHQHSRILVISEPEYKSTGIVFDALWLDVLTRDNTQQLCFEPEKLLELVCYTPISNIQLAA